MSSETQNAQQLYEAEELRVKSLETEIARLEADLEETKAFQGRVEGLEAAAKQKNKSRQLVISRLRARAREHTGVIAQHQKAIDEPMQQ